MSERITAKDREGTVRIITVSVCALELLIILFTLIYQQDVVKRTETPITEEMARVYLDNPGKLKADERIGLNPYSSMRNQQTYLLIKEEAEVVPFPWKAWVLIAVGVPIGIAFLVLLLTRAYLQAVGPVENEPAAASGKFVTAMNRLSQINILWFLLLSVLAIFLFWYIPELVKYTGGAAIRWLTDYWWFPATLFFAGIMVVMFWMYLQYRLRDKAMNLEMELAKFKFLQLEGTPRKPVARIENDGHPYFPLLEEIPPADEKPECKN